MSSRIDELVDMLYDMVSDAWAVPLSGEKCLLERDKALDLIEEIRANLPKDLETARRIVEDRNSILAEAKREGESIKREAEERARHMVAEDEILITARQRASELTTVAETRSRDICRAANEYVEDMLLRVEDIMNQVLDETKKSRQQFKNLSNTKRED